MPGESLIKLFGDYGGFIGLLVGTMLVGCSTAVVFLWRHNISLQKQLARAEKEHREQLQIVQDKRVDEAKEVRDEVVNLSSGFTKAVVELNSTMGALKDAVLLRNRG